MKLLEKNETILLEITALSHEGNGIGRYNGMVVFVPNTAAGDIAKVKMVKVLKNHSFGRVEEIITLSPEREENTCPVYPQCGGCSLRHITYEAEVAYKQKFVRDNMERIGKITTPFDEIMPSPTEERYRNKVQLPIRKVNGKIVAGFFAPRSHRIITIEDCLLQPELFSAMAKNLCAFMEEHHISAYDEESHSGLVRHLYLRYANATEQVMAVVVINGKALPHWEILLEQWQKTCPKLTTMLINHNTKKTNVITSYDNTVLYGKGYIVDNLLGIELELSADSFYQVNYQATEQLYRQAIEYANPTKGDILLDLYCGVGAIGLAMASKVKQLIGVEIVEKAVENARKNAERNEIKNAKFICSDAGKASKQLVNDNGNPTIIIIDPPRKGADQDTLDAVVTMAPNKIVYISCNSATLARDCAMLAEHGYQVMKGRAVDLFPRTPHVEAVVLLEKGK